MTVAREEGFPAKAVKVPSWQAPPTEASSGGSEMAEGNAFVARAVVASVFGGAHSNWQEFDGQVRAIEDGTTAGATNWIAGILRRIDSGEARFPLVMMKLSVPGYGPGVAVRERSEFERAEEQLCEVEAKLTEAERRNRQLSKETREALTAGVEQCLRGYALWQIESHNGLRLREIEHRDAKLIKRSGQRHRQLFKKLESYLTRSRDAVAKLEVCVCVYYAALRVL
ncbi:hypothetical protein AXG93_59s1110 [Marchantia polymorpha subsp. ruderalis]|uniref:Uncharacterized protein n=1 Tax=Marchantia polymorpha subsp. ruderalis TaxID=1480154 RepID=A0A176W2H9_MARPO|nr:hypothetical protein AXG93_59s1110 [Marchantia polymorpha subsp. ruderalis]